MPYPLLLTPDEHGDALNVVWFRLSFLAIRILEAQSRYTLL
jgi:hypothetical protein